jgi:hypothetical protein
VLLFLIAVVITCRCTVGVAHAVAVRVAHRAPHMQVIFSSAMKDPESFVPKQELVDAFPAGTQLMCTPNGSACPRTLDVLIESIISTFGPDGVKNLDGFRILIKLDGGPAFPQNDLAWLKKWADRGVVFHCGLPNGSAVNQASTQPRPVACASGRAPAGLGFECSSALT